MPWALTWTEKTKTKGKKFGMFAIPGSDSPRKRAERHAERLRAEADKKGIDADSIKVFEVDRSWQPPNRQRRQPKAKGER